MSTTSRILVSFLLLLATGLYFFSKNLTERVEREYFEAAEESMVDMVQIVAALLERPLAEGRELEFDAIRAAWESARKRPIAAKIYDMVKMSLDMNVYVTDAAGVVLFDSDGGKSEGQNFRQKRDVRMTLNGEYGARSTPVEPDKTGSIMHVAAPIFQNGRIGGVVSLSKAQSSLYEFRDVTRLRIRMACLVLFGAVTVGAYSVVTLFSRPIRRLTAYAQAVARGERVVPPEGGSGEAAMLRRAFEEMRDALEDRAYVEKYVQNVTHEMKSPVAAIRGAAELLREEMPPDRREKFLSNIQAEATRLQAIIDKLLALSVLEGRRALTDPKAMDLGALVHAVCDQLRPTLEASGVGLEIVGDGNPVVLGEAFLMESVIHNLLQNAVDFSPRDGRIRVQLGQIREHVEIVIEDTGPGIPEYALPRIFDRFYSLQRPGNGRKSSGLGLCFVREAVHLHRGTVEVRNRLDGKGARAVIQVPLAAAR